MISPLPIRVSCDHSLTPLQIRVSNYIPYHTPQTLQKEGVDCFPYNTPFLSVGKTKKGENTMENQPDKQPSNKTDSSSEQQGDGRGKSVGTQENLKQYYYPKGVSGNPSGRPVKNAKFIEALKLHGAEKPVNDWGDSLLGIFSETNNDAVVERVWKDAVAGNYTAIRLLMEQGVIEPDGSV